MMCLWVLAGAKAGMLSPYSTVACDSMFQKLIHSDRKCSASYKLLDSLLPTTRACRYVNRA